MVNENDNVEDLCVFDYIKTSGAILALRQHPLRKLQYYLHLTSAYLLAKFHLYTFFISYLLILITLLHLSQHTNDIIQ